jgi:hypothetical protein
MKILKIDDVWGVPTRFVKNLGKGWISFYPFVREKLKEKEKDLDFMAALQSYAVVKNGGELDRKFEKVKSLVENYIPHKTYIHSAESPIIKAIDILKEFEKLAENYNTWKEVYSFANIDILEKGDEKNSPIIQILREIKERYSLFFSDDYYYFNFTGSKILKEAAIYINAKDAEKEN